MIAGDFFDGRVPQDRVDAGAGILLPTYVAGPQSHGWWAAVLLDVVLKAPR